MTDSAGIADRATRDGGAGGWAGHLPDAPLAMPKQRLEPWAPSVRGLMAAVLRPLDARTGRSGG